MCKCQSCRRLIGKKNLMSTLKKRVFLFHCGEKQLKGTNPPQTEDTEAGWTLTPVTAVPLPGVTRLAGHEVSGSLVLHPLGKPQQNPGVVIPSVCSSSGGGQKVEKGSLTHKSQPSCFIRSVFKKRRHRRLSYEDRQFSSAAQRKLYMGILCT